MWGILVRGVRLQEGGKRMICAALLELRGGCENR
jgi:hypothetical protein